MLCLRQRFRVRERLRWSMIVRDWQSMSFFVSLVAWYDAVWREQGVLSAEQHYAGAAGA